MQPIKHMTFYYFKTRYVFNPMLTIPAMLPNPRKLYTSIPNFTFGKWLYPAIIPRVCCCFEYHFISKYVDFHLTYIFHAKTKDDLEQKQMICIYPRYVKILLASVFIFLKTIGRTIHYAFFIYMKIFKKSSFPTSTSLFWKK